MSSLGLSIRFSLMLNSRVLSIKSTLNGVGGVVHGGSGLVVVGVGVVVVLTTATVTDAVVI